MSLDAGVFDQIIDELSTKLGTEWVLFGINLGFSQAQMDQLQQSTPRNVSCCIKTMLQAWNKVVVQKGIDVCWVLTECLQDIGRLDLAQEIKDTLNIHDQDDNQGSLEAVIRQYEEELRQISFYQNTTSEIDKLIAQTQQCIFRWRYRSKFYVITNTWNHAFDLFQKHNILIIQGNSGDGKSTLAYYLLSKLAENNVKVINVTSPQAIERHCSPEDKVVFLVDDAFGTPTVNNQLVEDWIRLHDKLKSIHEGGSLGLIITTRTQVYKSCRVKVNSYPLYTEHVVDLCDKKFSLSENEKVQILERYCNEMGVTITDAVLEQIRSSTLSGFPLLCKLYVSDKTLQEVKDFFQTPLSVLIKQLQLLSSIQPVAYCGLVLMMTHDGKIPKSLFDVFSLTDAMRTHIGMIKEACTVESSVSLVKIRDEMETLVDVYITEYDDCFTFIHDAIFDAVTFVFGVRFPKQVLQFCSPKFLHDRVRSENARSSMYARSTIKDSLDSCSSKDVLFIQKRFTPDLAERLMKDVMEGYIFEVFNNPSIFDIFLQKCMIQKYTGLSSKDKRTFVRRKDKSNNKTVMHFVCFQGITDFVKTLIEDSVELTSEHLLTACNQTIGHEEIVSLLVDNDIDINEQPNGYGISAAHIAAVKGNSNLLSHLIALGADVNAKSEVEAEPIHLACKGGSAECVETLLLHGANPNAMDAYDHQPIHMTANHGHTACFHILVRHGADIYATDSFNFQAVHFAAQCSDSEILEFLLENNVDPNARSKDLRTPLFYACRHGRTKNIHLLLSKGADIGAKDINGSIPLHEACKSTMFDSNDISLLVGSSINAQNKVGRTPLHHACSEVKDGSLDKVRVLLQLGADLHIRDNTNMQALMYACDSNSIEIAKLLIENGADVNAKSYLSRQVIHFACANGNTALMTLLIDHGADPHAQSSDAGKQPIHFACKYSALDSVRQLLHLGVDVDAKDVGDLTPLFYACFEGNIEIAKLLLEHGADPNCKDYKNRQAIDMLKHRPCDDKLRELLMKNMTW